MQEPQFHLLQKKLCTVTRYVLSLWLYNVVLMCDLLYIFSVDELIIQGELFSVKKINCSGGGSKL